MIKIRKSQERGFVDHGWLKARHTFSFGSFYDPEHMHFGPLRVINQDKIAAHSGFPAHPHEDMEILTYIIKGELSHKDNTGGGSTIYPGRIQRMSAGTGIRHSEFNNSDSETELLQMWLLPDKKGHTPGYEEKTFDHEDAQNSLQLLVSGNDPGGALSINRQVNFYRSFLEKDKEISHQNTGKYQWVQLIEGELNVNGNILEEGDAIGLKDENALKIIANSKAHFVLFDMN